MERQASSPFHCSSTISWISSLFRRLYIHLCSFFNCLYIRQIWLIFLHQFHQ
uniref:ORF51d n=1 Tax=Pinus koraiensis TaxID=88728 RepID=A4QM89_PINKO|nr:ORF51d [Pinus koraiensis]ABP35426.1 ORF51d [Pinus koraiensis]